MPANKITRNLIVPLIDTAGVWTDTGAGTGAKWVPIDLSTTFEMEYNAQTDTASYICYKNDYTVHTGYQPGMDQEIALYEDNPMYKFINGLRHKMPVGGETTFPCLVAEVPASGTGATEGQVWVETLITIDTLNTVDGTLSFHLDFNGDPVDVTVTGLGTDNITVKKKLASEVSAQVEDSPVKNGAKAVK